MSLRVSCPRIMLSNSSSCRVSKLGVLDYSFCWRFHLWPPSLRDPGQDCDFKICCWDWVVMALGYRTQSKAEPKSVFWTKVGLRGRGWWVRMGTKSAALRWVREAWINGLRRWRFTWATELRGCSFLWEQSCGRLGSYYGLWEVQS